MKSSLTTLCSVAALVSLVACSGGAGDSAAPEQDGALSQEVEVAAGPVLASADPSPVAEPANPSTASAPSGAAPATETAAAPASMPTVLDGHPTIYAGVYTAAQANRGQQVQERDCSSCHAPADWATGRTLAAHAGSSVYDLLEHLRATMPLDGPGRLSTQEYTDVLAFIFQLNGLPAGSRELPADEVALDDIRVIYRR
jgi:S-disulfanyl-L-cysteine oxidoreductase SoxD